MDPDRVDTRYAAVVNIENNFVLIFCPAQPVVCLLMPANFHKTALTTGSTTMLKIVGENGSPCVSPLFVTDGHPKILFAFSNTARSYQYCCSNLCKFGPRTYPLRISMYLLISKDS